MFGWAAPPKHPAYLTNCVTSIYIYSRSIRVVFSRSLVDSVWGIWLNCRVKHRLDFTGISSWKIHHFHAIPNRFRNNLGLVLFAAVGALIPGKSESAPVPMLLA